MRQFKEIVDKTAVTGIVVAPAPVPDNLKVELKRLTALGHRITELAGGEETVSQACRMLENNEAAMLMQGDIPLDRFLAVLAGEGLPLDKLCFVSVFEDLKRNKLLFLADTYIKDFPGLQDKIDIINQVIALTRRLGLHNPKIAALSAIETVNPAIPSTVDAAVLAKMSERRQFAAVVDGPLDIDAILVADAAMRKSVSGPVPGNADIILCPDIETAYTLSQAFTHIGGFPTAGILLGTFKPVIIHPRLIPLGNKAVEVAIHSLKEGDNLG